MKYGIVELHDDYDFDTPISYKELVRCKECKRWNTNGCHLGVGECEWAFYMTKPDDYCSFGERKSDE